MCTTSLHSKFYKIVLWYELYKDNMDGLSATICFAQAATPGAIHQMDCHHELAPGVELGRMF